MDDGKYAAHPHDVTWRVRPNGKYYDHEQYDDLGEEVIRRRVKGVTVVTQTWFTARKLGSIALLLAPEHVEVVYQPEPISRRVESELSAYMDKYTVGLFTSHGVTTTAQLTEMSQGDLRRLKGIGRKRVRWVKEELSRRGLSLKEKPKCPVCNGTGSTPSRGSACKECRGIGEPEFIYELVRCEDCGGYGCARCNAGLVQTRRRR
jgi:hypothetical protein